MKDVYFNYPSIKSTDPEELEAAVWAVGMKRKFWEGTLEQEKIDKFNKTEGWSWCPFMEEGETWEMLGFK